MVPKTHLHPALGWNWRHPYLVISINESLGVFRPFIQRSLHYLTTLYVYSVLKRNGEGFRYMNTLAFEVFMTDKISRLSCAAVA